MCSCIPHLSAFIKIFKYVEVLNSMNIECTHLDSTVPDIFPFNCEAYLCWELLQYEKIVHRNLCWSCNLVKHAINVSYLDVPQSFMCSYTELLEEDWTIESGKFAVGRWGLAGGRPWVCMT